MISLATFHKVKNYPSEINFIKPLLLLIVLIKLTFSSNILHAQSMGISNTPITADASSILEMRTTTKGLLIPRMTTTQRDAISLPANGLIIYNSSSNQFNLYNGTVWSFLTTNLNNLSVFAATTSAQLASVLSDETGTGTAVFANSPTLSNPIVGTQTILDSSSKAASTAYVDRALVAGYLSVDDNTTLSTTSTSDTVITGMSKIASATGTYFVNFNAQCSVPIFYDTTGFSTADAAADLDLIYNDINQLPVTSTTHPLTFGSGETLYAGVYAIAGAASIAGNLTLDGGGNPNAIFVIKATGAFNTGAGVNVVLTNGASSNNVYWVAQGAIGLGAGTTIDGTLFSHGAAIAAGANSTITGRLLTTGGALSFGQGVLSVPTNPSSINFRRVTSFVMFTAGGGVANTGASTYNGDIGTNLGAITSFGDATVHGTIFNAGSTVVITPRYPTATFSLYKNGVLIPNSSRTRTSTLSISDISLQGIATVAAGQTIDVRWKIDLKTGSVFNRILTLIKVAN